MATITSLRQTYLNLYLARIDADTLPWTTATLDQFLTDAINALWPEHGIFTTGTVATDQTVMLYTNPGSIERVSRIDLLDANLLVIDRVPNFRVHSATQVLIKPLLATGYTLRFYGWKPFATTAADLPVRLESVVAQLGASLAYGYLTAHLTNSQRQQNLDSGRVIDYQQAAALSAYWKARADEQLFSDPSRVNFAPRRASR